MKSPCATRLILASGTAREQASVDSQRGVYARDSNYSPRITTKFTRPSIESDVAGVGITMRRSRIPTKANREASTARLQRFVMRDAFLAISSITGPVVDCSTQVLQNATNSASCSTFSIRSEISEQGKSNGVKQAAGFTASHFESAALFRYPSASIDRPFRSENLQSVTLLQFTRITSKITRSRREILHCRNARLRDSGAFSCYSLLFH